VLTEWEPAAGTGRSDTIARISRAVYEHLVPRGAPDA